MMQSRIGNGIRAEIYETLLLYAVFFLPRYLQTGSSAQLPMFESVYQNVMMLSFMIPQLLLLIFLISRKGMLHIYGFRPFKRSDVLWSLSIFIYLWAIVALLMILLQFLPLSESTPLFAPDWQVPNVMVYPLLLIVSLATGYLEEGFFRCYLYRQARRVGAAYLPSVIAISMLFGTGHMYEGIHGVIITTAMGILLQIFYTKRVRSIHPIAIGHGLYNFSVFILAILGK